MTEPEPKLLPAPEVPDTIPNSRGVIARLILEILGPEGLESLRGRRWTFIALVGPFLGFIADLSAVLGPVAWWGLTASGLMFLACAASILFRTRYAGRCAYPGVVALILALSFGIVVGGQHLTDASGQGFLLKEIHQIEERLAVVDQTTRRTEQKLDALTQQLVRLAPSPATPGTEKRLGEALDQIAKGAAAGDERLQRALDLLRANKLVEATQLLQEVADDKTARISRDSTDAAAAYRNLGAIAGLGDPKRAREAYARALTFDSDDVDSLVPYGELEIDAGDLDTAERALRRVLTLQAGQPVTHASYWARLLLGHIEQARGRLGPALTLYHATQALMEPLAATGPGDPEWQRNLSVSYNKVGDVLVAQGNLPEALKSYRDGLAIADRLARADPGNAGSQRDLSLSYEKVGDVVAAQGNLPEALKSYRDDLAIRDRLARADPGNAGWQRDLSVPYIKVGDVLVDQGNLPEALKSYGDSLAITVHLARADPGNAGWQRDLSVSYNSVGDVLAKQGNLPEALKSYRNSLVISDRLTRAEPDNAVWQRDLSVSYSKVGDVLVAQGSLPEALKSYGDSLAICDRQARADPGNADWQRDLSVGLARVAEALLKLDRNVEARPLAERALSQLRSAISRMPGDPRLTRDLPYYQDLLHRAGGTP